MKLRISELLDDYDVENMSVEADSGLDIGRVERLAMAKCAPAKQRGMRRGLRVGLIAAAAVLLLGVAAVAAYGWSLGDRVVTTMPEQENVLGETMAQFSAVGGVTAETMESDDAAAALTGSGSEHAALEEWMAYLSEEHDIDSYQRLEDDDMVGEIYGIGYQEMKNELERIAERYDLRLIQDGELSIGTAIYDAVDVSSLVAWPITANEYEAQNSNAWVYDDGSFCFQMYVDMPEGISDGEKDMLFFRMHCAKKGTLYAATEGGGELADYQTEGYTTATGTSVELALGKWYSMIFAELDDCYVTIHVSGGYEPSEYLPYLDMADLEQIAEAFDLTQLG